MPGRAPAPAQIAGITTPNLCARIPPAHGVASWKLRQFLRITGVALFAIWSSATPAAAQAPQSVSVTPEAPSVEINTTRQFTARVTGLDDKAVVWLVNDVIGGDETTGTISATGLFAAPRDVPAPARVTIRAASAVNPALVASAVVRISRPRSDAVAGADLPASRPAAIGITAFIPETASRASLRRLDGTALAPCPSCATEQPSARTTPPAPGAMQVPAPHPTMAGMPAAEPAAGTMASASMAAGTDRGASASVAPAPAGSDTLAGAIAAAVPRPGEPTSTADLVDYDAAVRFLDQATFGPTPALIAHVQQVGFAAFLDEQFAAPISAYADVISPSGTDPGTPLSDVQAQFYVNALQGADQLRQRVAFALEQIFVISQVKNNRADQFVPWLSLMNANAFGNFRTLMTDVTLSPAMGRYLDMVNNDKARADGTRTPNENYARELLQLFTLGPNPQDDDRPAGTNGQPSTAYTQEDIEELARVFTGWTYPVTPGASPASHNPAYYYGPMVAWQALHDTGSKRLLDGHVIPARQTAEQDLRDALDHIFDHPNVGPFICRRLIQHLVKSGPSPSYLWRVSRVFSDNGQGVRGDLRAVVTAILLDPEARAGDLGQAPLRDAGHLREPILYQTNLVRAAFGISDGKSLVNWSGAMGQRILSPATVFNYYHADYTLPNSATPAPEFEIFTPATTVARANFAYALTFGSLTGTTPDWSYWTSLAADSGALLDGLNHLMLHGRMSASMRNTIAAAVAAYPATQPALRAKQAFYLVATSSQYQVTQ